MKCLRATAIVLLVALAAGCSSEVTRRTVTDRKAGPLEVVGLFQTYLEVGRPASALDLLASGQRLQRQAVVRKVRAASDATLRGEYRMRIIAFTRRENCSVVVVAETRKHGRETFDLDPFYLLERDEVWKIAPVVTHYTTFPSLTAEEKTCFEGLQVWFEEMDDRLQQRREPEGDDGPAPEPPPSDPGG